MLNQFQDIHVYIGLHIYCKVFISVIPFTFDKLIKNASRCIFIKEKMITFLRFAFDYGCDYLYTFHHISECGM